jgi:glycine/D-amino acid oxidase-like deaminating enzyme
LSTGVAASIRAALADAAPTSFWLDSPDAPPAAPPLAGATRCDLAVVGAGYTGLWTALLAKQSDPGRDVLLIDGRTAGWAASGRNGGFCSSSLTHGLANGIDRFPDEMAVFDRLGNENLDAIESAISHYGIDCEFERTGELNVATEPHQLAWVQEDAAAAREFGHDAVVLDGDEVRNEVNSPTYLGASWHKDRMALVDPARLAWGLRAACEQVGVRIAEGTQITSLAREGAGVRVQSAGATVRAENVALATNAFRPLLRRIRPYIVPVYDYVLMTEPLSVKQLADLGWRNRQGIGDVTNQFHYYRLSADNRILWGGYDAIYHFRNGLRDDLDQRPATFERLAQHFFATFPQLDGLRFTHTWGGAIDTSTRFFAFQRTALGGRVAYSVGYTGLGVAASRFGATVMLDLLAGRESEATRLRALRHRPVPFPPEPVRYAGIQLTRRALARADARQGRRGPWLRLLDRLGMGFDS